MKATSSYLLQCICLVVLSGLSYSAWSRTIAVLGDSLSAAYNIPIEQGWVALLEDDLTQEGGQYTIVNASVSGATTAAGLQRLPSLLSDAPDVLILALGANDGLQGKPLAYIRRQLERLIRRAQAKGTKVLLVGIRIPPNYGSAYTVPFFEQYAALAQAYDTHYVPFLLDGVAGVDGLMMDDGLHPTAEAQQRIMENVKAPLQALLTDLNDGERTQKSHNNGIEASD